MKSFLIWYRDAFVESLRAVVWWAHDGSGWIPICLAVGAFMGGYFGLSWLADANEFANLLVGISTVVVFLGIIVVGPLIVAYRRQVSLETRIADLEKKMNRSVFLSFPRNIRFQKTTAIVQLSASASRIAGQKQFPMLP